MSALFLRFLSLWIAFVLSVSGTLGHAKQAGSAYDAEDADNVLLYAAVVSDLHTNGYVPHKKNTNLMRLLSGVSKTVTPLDALVFPGDLTESAQAKEYEILSHLLRTYTSADAILPALGNHDVRGNMLVTDYDVSMQNYYAFCRSLGIQTETPYWSSIVNGCHFLVLGSDAEVKDSAYISPEQLLWLDQTLTRAAQSGMPAFVICHQPLAHTNNVDASWPGAGTLGEQSDAVYSLLCHYADTGLPIVYISGHLHDDFSEHTFECPHDNLYCLNLPSAQYNDGGGKGVTLEVYADRVLLRSRNFITGEWLPDVYTIPLSDAQ